MNNKSVGRSDASYTVKGSVVTTVPQFSTSILAHFIQLSQKHLLLTLNSTKWHNVCTHLSATLLEHIYNTRAKLLVYNSEKIIHFPVYSSKHNINACGLLG